MNRHVSSQFDKITFLREKVIIRLLFRYLEYEEKHRHQHIADIEGDFARCTMYWQ